MSEKSPGDSHTSLQSVGESARQLRQNSTGWMIQQIAAAVQPKMESALTDPALTMLQFAVMMTVFEHGKLTQTEIGQRFSAKPPAVSRAVDQLENGGLLKREPHPTSRRTNLVSATESGLKLAPSLMATAKLVNGGLLDPLNDEEKKQFLSMLSRLLEHVRPGTFSGNPKRKPDSELYG